jgi:PIN domain nuclease of toxin-antitoxin system
MTRILIDTHVLAWSMINPSGLPTAALSAIESASVVFVPPCALHEITLKVRNGKWNEMAEHAARLDSLCLSQGFEFAPYTARMAMAAGSIEWAHRDPFDRMIAATAIELSCPVISKDPAFDGLDAASGWQGRIWNGEV